MDAIRLDYKAGGPILAAFIRSDAAIKSIMGPQGGGKTAGCLWHIIERAIRQRPSTLDGVRKSRWAVIRDTYRNLEQTTIRTWHDWVPKEVGHWSGDAPMNHSLLFDVPRIGRVQFDVTFMALGEQRVEDMMRGWEGTGAYINEADRLSRDVITFVAGRVNPARYPSQREGGATWSGVWCDYNAPDEDNWTYNFFDAEPPEGVKFFRQPSGYSPHAENLKNLAPDYYDRLKIGQPDWWIRRFIKNEYGYSREGRPVYEHDFSDDRHVATDDLAPAAGIIVDVGGDAGRHPAAVFCQQMPNGQVRVIDEIYCVNMGAEQFGEVVNRRLAEPFWRRAGALRFRGWGDPTAGNKGQNDERTWLDIMTSVTGFKWEPAPVPTNNIEIRLAAVRGPLARDVGGEPGMILSRFRCKMLRKGFNASYRFKRIQIQGRDEYADTPEKNEWSNPHDALQYDCLGMGTHQAVFDRGGQSSAAPAPASTSGDYNEFK